MIPVLLILFQPGRTNEQTKYHKQQPKPPRATHPAAIGKSSLKQNVYQQTTLQVVIEFHSPANPWLDVSALIGLLRSLCIYHAQPWRRRALHRFYASLIEQNALVFDIGAHVGNRILAVLALGGRCVAVEPQPLFSRLLRILFGNNPRVHLINDAVGGAPGQAQLQISRRHPTVSSLSTQWIDSVQSTQGFQNVSWDRSTRVAVTTLDILIRRFGLPDFCKIDVEGMEAEILAGLSTAVPLIAVEYMPARLDIAHACVQRLCTLGDYRFNLSAGESHCLSLQHWVNAESIGEELQQAARSGRSGDLYARLVVPSSVDRMRSIDGIQQSLTQQ
jgi:FkbM family methyltransferase